MSELRTILYDEHVALGGKMVAFGGFSMPVTYKATGLINEHEAVRKQAGLFDVSHMGSLILQGKDALANLQQLLSNDFLTLADGQVRYTLMLNEKGGVIDDFVVYRYHENKYLLVVNAANREKDYKWIESHLTGDCELINASSETGILALQGPAAKEILSLVTDVESLPQKYYHFKDNIKILNFEVMISRTGYTGEFGYEIYVPKKYSRQLWDELLRVGHDLGLVPCGLGARDTLRLEAGLPLYGNEMDERTIANELGLNFAIKLGKDDFIGKTALLENEPVTTYRVGLKVTGKGIVREEAELFVDDTLVGVSTSGTHSPTLGYGIAMGRVTEAYHKVGTQLQAHVRKRVIPIEVVPLPFYQRINK